MLETLFISSTNLLYYFFAFVVILTIIVFIHEFGHYSVAKLSGVKIETFSIGFGKEIFGWNDRSGTRWKICWLPFGGYVKMFGDINAASIPDKNQLTQLTEAEKAQAFHTKPLRIKAAIVAAGPLANFLLAILILTFFYSYYGKPATSTQISQVMAHSAAEEAGIRPGDIILSLDDKEVKQFDDVKRIIALNTGKAVTIEVLRDDETITFSLTPKFANRTDIFGNDVQLPLLGIQSNVTSLETLGIGGALFAAISETYYISSATLKAIGQMITGQRSTKEISGPIGIAKYSGQSLQAGITTVLWFIVIISINLGLINLFPIPVLDGGHLMYYAIEAIRGKPLADRYQEYGFKFGMLLILLFAAFAIFNDINKLKLF